MQNETTIVYTVSTADLSSISPQYVAVHLVAHNPPKDGNLISSLSCQKFLHLKILFPVKISSHTSTSKHDLKPIVYTTHIYTIILAISELPSPTSNFKMMQK